MNGPLVVVFVEGLGAEPSHASPLALLPKLAARSDVVATTVAAAGAPMGLADGVPGSAAHGYEALSVAAIPARLSDRVAKVAAAGRLGFVPEVESAFRAADHLSLPPLASMTGDEPGDDRTCRVHLVTLVSESPERSTRALRSAFLQAAEAAGARVVVHAILDGHDGSRRSAARQLELLEAELGGARLGTVSGRSYGLAVGDWPRATAFFEALVRGRDVRQAESWFDVLHEAYDLGLDDPDVPPTRVGGYAGLRGGFMADFAQGDRAWRWMGEELVFVLDARGDGFEPLASLLRRETPADVTVRVLTEHGREVVVLDEQTLFSLSPLDVPFEHRAAFRPEGGQALGLFDRIAATGRSAMVIGSETRPHHVRRLARDPGVEVLFAPTERGEPELGVAVVTRAALGALARNTPPSVMGILVAELDRAGHAARRELIERALAAVDHGLCKLADTVRDRGGILALVGTHGNVEKRCTDAGEPFSGHTDAPVPFAIVAEGVELARREGGTLADAGATLSELAQAPLPSGATGRSLVGATETAG